MTLRINCNARSEVIITSTQLLVVWLRIINEPNRSDDLFPQVTRRRAGLETVDIPSGSDEQSPTLFVLQDTVRMVTLAWI